LSKLLQSTFLFTASLIASSLIVLEEYLNEHILKSDAVVRSLTPNCARTLQQRHWSSVTRRSLSLLCHILYKNRNRLSRSKCIGETGSHQPKSGGAGWVGSDLGEFIKGYPLSNNF